MNLNEKMSYLQGLVDGLEIDASTKEGKALIQMTEVMKELVMYVEDLQGQVDELTELCDILDEDLGNVEEDMYELDSLDGDYDDLDDDTKENIDLGLISLEDAVRGLGGSMYGPRVTELRIKALARNSAKGSEPTVYSEENLKKPPIVEETEESVDIFDEDEDI